MGRRNGRNEGRGSFIKYIEATIWIRKIIIIDENNYELEGILNWKCYILYCWFISKNYNWINFRWDDLAINRTF